MKYVCAICGYVYDEEKEGVPFSELAESWTCPGCGAEKAMFDPVQETAEKETVSMGKAKYLVQRVLNMNYKAMMEKINSIHRKTGRSRLAIFRDMKDCAVKYGAGYMDYDLFEMYNLTPEQRDTYLTRGRNNALVVKYNDKAYTGQFDDKVQFNTLFGKYLHRDWVPVTGDNREQVMAFLAAHEVFMAKPSQGSCGWGIEKLRRADYPSLDALYDYLVQRAPKLELEEVLEQHPQVSAIYPGSINTVRMVTIRGKHGKVYLASEAAQVIPQVGYVGWDVCFTPNGPCLVEGNPFPGHDIYQLPVHTPDKIGIMPRFREIEAQEQQAKR